MTWWYAVTEAKHELQNPTSFDKIRLLGERLGLRPDSRVLDIGAGKGGPARLLAEEFGCRITCGRGRHYRDRYLHWIRDLMGWAILICRRPGN